MATSLGAEPMGSGKLLENQRNDRRYLRNFVISFCGGPGRRKLQGVLDELVQQSKEVEER